MLRKSDVELLVVILPHNVHAEVAVKCLKAGRHVVVEKPFAITVKECDAMIAAAKKSKVLLSTYHNRHWDSNILTIMKHLPKIGRPFRWESHAGGYGEPGEWWRSYKKFSGGIIYDWGAHFTEWMLQVMRTTCRKSAATRWPAKSGRSSPTRTSWKPWCASRATRWPRTRPAASAWPART